MTMSPLRPPPRRTELRRLGQLCGTLACALACGLVELLALQRKRLRHRRLHLQRPQQF